MNSELWTSAGLTSTCTAVYFGCFAIDVLGFAVMGNHFHVIRRNRPDIVDGWTRSAMHRVAGSTASVAREAARRRGPHRFRNPGGRLFATSSCHC